MYQEIPEHTESYLATMAVVIALAFAIIVGFAMIHF